MSGIKKLKKISRIRGNWGIHALRERSGNKTKRRFLILDAADRDSVRPGDAVYIGSTVGEVL